MAGITLEGIPWRARRRGLSITITSVSVDVGVPGQIGFTYTLPATKWTSGAVYDSADDGATMVRRLWDGLQEAEGTYAKTWDGEDDSGTPVAEGTYYVRITHHNIHAIPHKVGNNSASPVGYGLLQQFMTSQNVRVTPDGTYVKASLGYTESTVYSYEMEVANPNWWTRDLQGTPIYWTTLDMQFDATYCYRLVRNNTSYEVGLIKQALADGSLATWSSLTPDAYNFLTSNNAGPGLNYGGTFLLIGTNASSTDFTYQPTRIAVQRSGNAIALAFPDQGLVQTVHKSTGATFFTPIPSLANATCVAWSVDDSKLFVTAGSALYPYTKANWLAAGSATTTGDINAAWDYTGDIIDLVTNRAANEIVMAIGGYGSSQLVVAVDEASPYTESWTLGVENGYATDAGIDADRFRFGNNFQSSISHFPGCISFGDDGKLWIWECALGRLQQFTQPSVDATVGVKQWVVPSYTATSVVNEEELLIGAGLIGFVRDFSVDPTPGTVNTAWAPTWYWGDPYYDDANHHVFGAYPAGLYNTHRFAIIHVSGATHILAELSATGVREIDATYPHTSYVKQFWMPNGDRYYPTSNTVIVKEAYGGLDGSNNPIWGAASTYATITNTDGLGPIMNAGNGNMPFGIMADGAVAVIRSTNYADEAYYQLGLMNTDGTWRWRALHPKIIDLPIPRDGNGTVKGNSGPTHITVCRDGQVLIVSWPGEFYYNSQLSAHYLFDLRGAFLTILGNRSPEIFGYVGYPASLQAGNVNYSDLVVGNDGDYHYIGNGENHASAIFDVHLDNWSSVVSDVHAIDLGDTYDFGLLTGAVGAPNLISEGSEVDIFDRADSSTLGGDWTDPNSSFRVVSNLMQGRTTNTAAFNINYHAYRSGSFADYAHRIYIPSLWAGYGWPGSGMEFTLHLGARFDPVTKLFIGVQAQFLWFTGATGATANGKFRINLVSYDGSEWASLNADQAAWLDLDPGHFHALEMGCSGSSPTYLWGKLWDVDENRLILPMETEIYDPRFDDPGAPVVLGTYKASIYRYESLNVSKTQPVIPFATGVTQP